VPVSGTTVLGGYLAETAAVIPSATITILSVQNGVERTVTNDSKGRYTMQQLAPGSYRLTAKAAGFSDVTMENVTLLVDQPATLPIVFERVGSTQTSIVVESGARPWLTLRVPHSAMLSKVRRL
jgi:Carboxypeptidase regulatory-like domain